MHNSSKAVSIAQNNVINKKLPDEIFALIFSFIGPLESQKHNGQYLLLSWVCRRWRAIVLHNSSFWTALCYDHRWGTRRFMDGLETMLRRSKTQPLDIFITDDFEYTRCPHLLNHFQKFDLSRVRSLFWEVTSIVELSNAVGWSDFSAPNLENLSFRVMGGYMDHDGFDLCLQFLFRLISTSRLRYLRISSSSLSLLHGQGIFRHLSHVEWLKLDQDALGDFLGGGERDFPSAFDILKSLEELPNLKILNYLSQYRDIHPLLSDKAVTLPKLRMLSLDNRTDFYCNFQAPNLDYFSIFFNETGCGFDNCLLNNFNFSRTSNITICTTSCPEGRPSFSSYFVACISGADNSTPMDCASFAEFDRTGLTFGANLNGYLELPAKNSFHTIYRWDCERKHNGVPIPVKLATALVELTLDTGIWPRYAPPDKHLWRFLADILRSVKTIVSLRIIYTRVGLANVCKLLEEEPGITPRLERLTYHSSRLVKATSFLVHRLKMVQSARLKCSSQPLKVLRVRNFSTVPSDEVLEIEELGIMLVQEVDDGKFS